MLRRTLQRRRERSLPPTKPPLRLTHRRNLLILHLNQRTRRPIPALQPLHALPIRLRIECQKQYQIARDNHHSTDARKLLTGTRPHVGHPREVGRGEVGVGGEVDEAQIDDELQDLQDGDVLFPPGADAAGGLEVVPVHDDVDEEVEGDGDPGDGGVAVELGEAEEGGGAVVVGMEECWWVWVSMLDCRTRRGRRHTQRLLLEEEEDGVDKLEVFCQVVELIDPLSAVELDVCPARVNSHNTAQQAHPSNHLYACKQQTRCHAQPPSE